MYRLSDKITSIVDSPLQGDILFLEDVKEEAERMRMTVSSIISLIYLYLEHGSKK